MKWRDAFDLPHRFERCVPAVATQVVIAFTFSAIAIVLRAALDLFSAGVVPFALIFPAIVFATLLGGFLAGMLTLATCQLLAWYFLLPPARSFFIERPADGISLILTTCAEAFILWATAVYRRSAHAAADHEGARAEGLALALQEMDHRTKNNFQIAASLLRLQARRSSPEVADALVEAANRISSIASTHDNLAISTSLSHINLRPYLGDICTRLCKSLGQDLEVDVELADCEVERARALSIGLIVNELITNAIKHAFPDGWGRLVIKGHWHDNRYILTLADNGPGTGSIQRSGGLGANLITMLARQERIRLQKLPPPGTGYKLEVPCEI